MRQKINTVLEFKQADAAFTGRHFSVVTQHTIMELREISSLRLEAVVPASQPASQQIMCSRSFGSPITQLVELQQVIISYMTRAAEKLRSQSSVSGAVDVFISASPFRAKDAQYNQGLTVTLLEAGSNTLKLVQAGLWGLKRVYRPGYCYAKTGVILMDLAPVGMRQASLFADNMADESTAQLMQIADSINRKMGKDTIFLAGAGIESNWQMKQGNKSPCYTTAWNELAVAHC
ncbi:MAG: DUF4113 domain-containing protein [Nitrosomonas sp.]|nr:DUF4113 domain-containing protein [Nitrosomonas sp.]MDP1951973.1 DUF4113 domain-containing protein [Nitrosomonas sp.]